MFIILAINAFKRIIMMIKLNWLLICEFSLVGRPLGPKRNTHTNNFCKLKNIANISTVSVKLTITNTCASTSLYIKTSSKKQDLNELWRRVLNREVFLIKIKKPKVVGSSGDGCVYHSIRHSRVSI